MIPKGHKMSAETRKRMSDAKRGKTSNFKGKSHRPESKVKQSEAAKLLWQQRKANAPLNSAIDNAIEKIEDFLNLDDDQHHIDAANPRCRSETIFKKIANFIVNLK